jgi:isoleucyl-tRNA synthetase
VRSEVQKVLEGARRDKLIGSSLEAKVVLCAEGELAAFLAARQAELPALFIASKVELAPQAPEGASRAEGGLPLSVKVERAPGTKCPRCWNYSEAIDGGHPVCPKCAEALRGWEGDAGTEVGCEVGLRSTVDGPASPGPSDGNQGGRRELG